MWSYSSILYHYGEKSTGIATICNKRGRLYGMRNSLYYNILCDLMSSEETWMSRIVLAHPSSAGILIRKTGYAHDSRMLRKMSGVPGDENGIAAQGYLVELPVRLVGEFRITLRSCDSTPVVDEPIKQGVHLTFRKMEFRTAEYGTILLQDPVVITRDERTAKNPTDYLCRSTVSGPQCRDKHIGIDDNEHRYSPFLVAAISASISSSLMNPIAAALLRMELKALIALTCLTALTVSSKLLSEISNNKAVGLPLFVRTTSPLEDRSFHIAFGVVLSSLTVNYHHLKRWKLRPSTVHDNRDYLS